MTKHALYRFYNDGGQLLYVGITNDPPRRMKRHSEKKSWWPKVRGLTFDWYPDRSSVLAAEKRAIRIENPLHNIVGRPVINGAKELAPEQRLINEAVNAFISAGGPEADVSQVRNDIEQAIRNGYSWREICAAASLFGEIDVLDSIQMPPYPGHMTEEEINKSSEAMRYLAQFIGPEVRRFRAAAEGAAESFNAHPYEITIQAAEIALSSIEEGGRNRFELLAFLKTKDSEGWALKQAYGMWNQYGTCDIEPESIEIVEIAVSLILGAPVPHGPDAARDVNDAIFIWRDTWKRCHPEGETPREFDEMCFEETVRLARHQGCPREVLLRASALAGSRVDPSVREFLPPLNKS